MKKIIAVLLLFIAVKTNAQKAILFKMKYLPQRSYSSAMNIKININADLSGDQQVLDKLKEQGFAVPVVANISSNFAGVTKTGAVSPDNTFPMTMNFKMEQPAINVSGKDIPLPAQLPPATIYAHILSDGKIHADSVSGQKKDTSGKQAMQMINSIQNQIKFPDRPLHVGDSFTQDIPFNMPMNMGNRSISSKAVYTLVKIADGRAFFDVAQSIEINMGTEQNKLSISGTGTGKLIYSIKDNFPINYNTIVNMNINGSIKSLVIKGTMLMNMDFKYDIN